MQPITTGSPQVRRFSVALEWDADDRVWVTYVPALGFLSTYGDTREEALARTKEAIMGYLEAAEEEGLPFRIMGWPELD